MTTINPGDEVRYLNASGGGRVTRIQGNTAYVEDADGFEMPVLLKEIIRVESTHAVGTRHGASAEGGDNVIDGRPERPPLQGRDGGSQPPVITAPSSPFTLHSSLVEETPNGDVLNLTLAFEPHDIKALSTTKWDVVLVNDSNYFVTFAYASRQRDETQWTPRRQDVVEPNTVLVLEEIEGGDWARLDRIALQGIAFKADKPYLLQAPINYEGRVDGSKAFRLHCYQPNEYFDGPVLSRVIVRDGQPMTIQPSEEEQAVERVRQATRRPIRPKAVDRPQAPKVQAPATAPTSPLVIDLHAAALLDNTHGLSSADILNHQIDTFRQVMDAHLRFPGLKIVFIHGKGDGVLRHAITKELNYRYKGHRAQDASFQEYGYGATQVTIAANTGEAGGAKRR